MIKIGYLTYIEHLSITGIQFDYDFLKETVLNLQSIALFDFPDIPIMKTKYTTKKYFDQLFKSSVYSFISTYYSKLNHMDQDAAVGVIPIID